MPEEQQLPGVQRYVCKLCGRQWRALRQGDQGAGARHVAIRKIARFTGASPAGVLKWIRKAAEATAERHAAGQVRAELPDVIEMDKIYSRGAHIPNVERTKTTAGRARDRGRPVVRRPRGGSAAGTAAKRSVSEIYLRARRKSGGSVRTDQAACFFGEIKPRSTSSSAI